MQQQAQRACLVQAAAAAAGSPPALARHLHQGVLFVAVEIFVSGTL
jgi:hypothetical protein